MKMLISKLNLNESFICAVWENSENYSGLKTTDGKCLEIHDYGSRNFDAGPDYLNARISIDGRLFSGSIEIHREPGDWYRHRHRKDRKFSEVILHVVLFADDTDAIPAKAFRSRSIPTLVLSQFLIRPLKEIWKELVPVDDELSLPCFPHGLKVPQKLRRDYAESLGIERLLGIQNKIAERVSYLRESYMNYEAEQQTVFEYICEALGYSKNKEQFIKLARRIELPALIRLRPDKFTCDAIMFGAAGFLSNNRFSDEYTLRVKEIWEEIRADRGIMQMNKSEWNFFRLRPVNFPTLRLAYASGILYFFSRNNFSEIVKDLLNDAGNMVRSLREILSGIEVSDYWKQHYHFGRKKNFGGSMIGTQRIDAILVNVLMPFALLIAEETGKSESSLAESFRKFKISGGKSVSTRWMESETGIFADTHCMEQGLIKLYKDYCSLKKCHECEIGKHISGKNIPEEPIHIIMY